MTAGGEVKDRQRNVVAAAYSGGNSVTQVELPHYGEPPYPVDTEWSRLAVTELATGTGAEPRTQTRVETAGENLQRVSVQIRRPRWWCFLWGEIPLTLSRKFTRFLQA